MNNKGVSEQNTNCSIHTTMQDAATQSCQLQYAIAISLYFAVDKNSTSNVLHCISTYVYLVMCPEMYLLFILDVQ